MLIFNINYLIKCQIAEFKKKLALSACACLIDYLKVIFFQNKSKKKKNYHYYFLDSNVNNLNLI